MAYNQVTVELEYIARMQSIVLMERKRIRLRNVALQPWNSPPEGHRPFDEMGTQPATGTSGTQVVIASFRVRKGYDGIIKKLTFNYQGNNFHPGSGELYYGVRIDGVYAHNYGTIAVDIGDTQNGKEVIGGIEIKSGQLVELTVDVAAAFVPQDVSFFAGAQGYFYPNGVARTN